MKEMIQIPAGLNVKEKALYRSLMRAKEGNAEKKWVYNSEKFLIGHKRTDAMNGEVKVTFDYQRREDAMSEKDSFDMVAKELEKMKKSFEQKIEKTERELEDLKAKAGKIETALGVLKEIKEVD